MAKNIQLKVKQNFTDKETKEDYKKGHVYSFSEKRAEELLKNHYIVEEVGEKEIKEDAKNTENASNKK